MKLLAIETATEACSAALLVGTESRMRYEYAPRRHTELILPMCDSLLHEAGIQASQLDAIAFGRGPGSFTGVRIAAGVAQGIAFAWNLPVVPVSTLAVMAQEAIMQFDVSLILSAIDARMQEVYWGVYQRDDNGLAKSVIDESVIQPQAVFPPVEGRYYGVGSGWKTYREALSQSISVNLTGYDGELLPKARYLIPLAECAYTMGHAVAAEDALPVYLRNEVVKNRDA